MNQAVTDNFNRLKTSLFVLPLFLLAALFYYFYSHDALTAESYIALQKDCFLNINNALGHYPVLMQNLTYFGDSMIFLSLLSIFILYTPKMWEALITASLAAMIFSRALKFLFAVPRPAAALDNKTFIILGKALRAHNSLPSGHAITIFTVLTVVLFALMPKKNIIKFFWVLMIIGIGLLLIFTRVGVGAHFPADVIVGGLVGYICALVGIFISNKYHFWSWIAYRKYYPFFIFLFLGCFIAILIKTSRENLLIFYFPLMALVVSIYKFTMLYVKR